MNTEDENNYNNGFCFCSLCKSIVPLYQSFDQINQNEAELFDRIDKLPKVKAKPDFERKMMALFAIELDNEVHRINQAWLRKSRKIRLPNLISDLKSELL